MKVSLYRKRATFVALGFYGSFATTGCGSDGVSSQNNALGTGGFAGASGAIGASGAVGSGGVVVAAAGGLPGSGATPGSGAGGANVGAGGGAIGAGGIIGAGGAPASGGAAGAIGAGGAASGGSAGAAAGGSAGSTGTSEKFSFFVTSFEALKKLSNNQQGFGGDLRFGEAGAGAGLRGADKICSTIAETSLKGAGAKGWHAFLSAADDGTGKPVNAIDRVGKGPWYDRLGRLFGNTVMDINATRPTMADPAIANDFPNEDGVPNHAPDPTMAAVDNHDTLTGSDTMGRLYGATATCLDWTSGVGDTAKEGKPRCGHSWPRAGGMGMGPGGPGGGDMNNWMSALTESGCKAGANLIEQGGPMSNAVTVGSGGGYGGFYCFAMTP